MYGLTFSKSPASWRLVKQSGDKSEEVIFTMQGVIEGKNLPPVGDSLVSRIPNNKAHFMTQSVTLSGLGTPTFEESLSALTEMYTVFCRQFPEGRVLPLPTAESCIGIGGSLTFSNRHFTKRAEGPHMKAVPFSSLVDPKKYLTRMLSSTLIHTEENEVQYFTRYSDMGQNYKYLPAGPQQFRLGDIVEVQFSMVVYQMRTQYYVVKPMLYSVALLDGKYANELLMRATNVPVNPEPHKILKRKIGYPVEEKDDIKRVKGSHGEGEGAEESEDSSVSGGLAKMSIDK
ncbi:hypothetical protein BDN72DRAFT_776823 [Pluteus cervinus]|uniref:Uncharacterized protein n=1 Tax=Pluteus cervinus TaxID=181527 RepID=A0ACD3ABJ0_9AGAR|nr:hypothetical protein BDN72DRAFT_776823 [Pluteus cervinus]